MTTQPAGLQALFECLHHANPTDDSQWHVKPGMHNAFSKAVSALAARPTAPAAEWQEPPLTCPHIDAAEASGELSEAVLAELATIRDINSHLRYGTWALKAQLEAALAARSIPEAGKAVDIAQLLTNCAQIIDVVKGEWSKEGAWSEWDQSVRNDISKALSTLASVPAPSGAELIAQWQVWVDADNDHGMDAGWVNEDADMIEHWRSQGRKVRALYAAPQAVPAEDVASLPQKLRSLAAQIDPLLLGGPDARLLNEAAAALTSLSAERDEARSGLAELDQVFDKLWEADRRAIKLWQEATGKDHIWPDRTKMTLWLLERLTASEAEAASLRRKLEEHRRALAVFGEVADWYHASESDDFEIWKDYPQGFISREPAKLKHYRRARTLSGASE